MKKIISIITYLTIVMNTIAQERTVENRPYTDLRTFHFGVLVGTHLQDIELLNVGLVNYTDENGKIVTSNVTVDQDRWDAGFTVGVLGEFRINTNFQVRIAPAMYFGTRHLTFHDIKSQHGEANEGERKIEDVRQEMKTAYISSAFDIIFSAPRFNNHRPYLMAGVTPMLNLSGSKDEYIALKKTDLFLELGIGCDFYLPFFKLRPELKFMFGLTNTYDKNHIKNIKDKSMLPYTLAAKETHSKIVALTFYFE